MQSQNQIEQQFRLKGSLELPASEIPGRYKYTQRTWLQSTAFLLELRAGNNPSHYFKWHGSENSWEKEKTKTMLCKATWYFILLILSVHTPIPLHFSETRQTDSHLFEAQRHKMSYCWSCEVICKVAFLILIINWFKGNR